MLFLVSEACVDECAHEGCAAAISVYTNLLFAGAFAVEHGGGGHKVAGRYVARCHLVAFLENGSIVGDSIVELRTKNL